ncbi:hypothetical protein F1559_002149 [Cyanidiococcus yangmingshanensis]|uniref:Transcriptional adapter 2-alpha n=1 Tax=Cyanidiococcus yangmingshanensis TaxID=2690220 RepID=A0A7J7IMP7_9RHOD|nr:hypothetical protein F1559_002149 [Cyanidiococcus yangmingshanensis]
MAARQSSTSRRSRSKPKRAAAVPPTSGDQLQTNGRSAEGRSHRPTTPPHTRGVVSESPSLAVGTAAGTSTFAEATLTRRPSLAPRVYGARYRCNYCSRDVSNCTRITCAACSDFDLCISCFSVGACLYPHELSHPYRVVEHVSRPVFSSDWSAEEEMRLLEGLEIYGPGNFHTVAEYVGTKSKIKCEQHYLEVYLDAEDTAPLPNPKRMVTDMRVVLPAIPVGTPRSAVVAREMALTAAAAANLNPALARLAQIRLKANESRGTEMEITDASKPSWDERSTRLAADDGLVTASALSPTARRDDWLSEQKGPATDKSSDNTSVDLLSSGSPTMVPSEINLSAVLADEEAQSIRVSPSGRPRKGDIVGYMSKTSRLRRGALSE